MALSTPIEKKAKKRRRKIQPAGPWVAARRIVQYLSLFLFIVLFVAAKRGGWLGNLVNIPMRLDPLLILANLLASHVFLAGSALALIVIVLTLVFGRAWCGWLCPLGTILDLFPVKHERKKGAAPAEGWRGVKYYLVLATLAAALFGNLTLLFFDPLTLFFRTLAVSLWPGLDQVITSTESALYNIPVLAGPISTLDSWIRPALLPSQPVFYQGTVLFATIFLGVILLNWFAPRFWCRYLCPLGGFLGLLSKPALFRRRVNEECKGCTLCTAVCPTGTIDPENNYRSDPGECTVCMDCVEICPRGLNSFKPSLSLSEWNPQYDPGRREALTAIGATIAAVALFHRGLLAKSESPFLLRPPGVRENNPDPVALTKCTRCGECLHTCPTGALQPAVSEAGLEGFATPILIMRMGYCDYSCNACGQVCPVQAIPPLGLAEKQTQVMGKAYIDESRCIAWSDHRSCIVCQEMCPLPKKAVQLEVAQVWSPDGGSVQLQLPHVVRDLCIGCGLCEYHCPVSGQAAIRIYNPAGGVVLQSG